jgi:hypothetical protein
MLPRSLALRHVAPLLMALALFARMLVPAGFMPAANGVPGLVICTGAGAMVLPVAAMPMEHQAPGDSHHDGEHSCPFAPMAAAADLAAPLPAPVLPFLSIAAARVVLAIATRPGLGLAAPPPPKTGPPFFR